MLFPVASLFSGNATVKAIDKLPLFKQGDKENARPKIHPHVGKRLPILRLCSVSVQSSMQQGWFERSYRQMYCLRGWLLYFRILGKSNDWSQKGLKLSPKYKTAFSYDILQN